MVIWGTVHYCSTHSHTILDITTCKTISNILLYILYTTSNIYYDQHQIIIFNISKYTFMITTERFTNILHTIIDIILISILNLKITLLYMNIYVYYIT